MLASLEVLVPLEYRTPLAYTSLLASLEALSTATLDTTLAYMYSSKCKGIHRAQRFDTDFSGGGDYYRLSVVGVPLIPQCRSHPPTNRTSGDDGIKNDSLSLSLFSTGHCARGNKLSFCGAIPPRRAIREIFKKGNEPLHQLRGGKE